MLCYATMTLTRNINSLGEVHKILHDKKNSPHTINPRATTLETNFLLLPSPYTLGDESCFVAEGNNNNKTSSVPFPPRPRGEREQPQTRPSPADGHMPPYPVPGGRGYNNNNTNNNTRSCIRIETPGVNGEWAPVEIEVEADSGVSSSLGWEDSLGGGVGFGGRRRRRHRGVLTSYTLSARVKRRVREVVDRWVRSGRVRLKV